VIWLPPRRWVAKSEHCDHLDGAFLNAGVGTFQPIEAATPKNYDDMFNVNVRGLYFSFNRCFLVRPIRARFVFTSSIAGSIAYAGLSIYSATQGRDHFPRKTLAVELAPRGMRVNVLSPGPIDTTDDKENGPSC